MIYGMPTLIETKSIDECVVLCKSLGLAFIELNMNLPDYQTDRIDIEKLNYIREHQRIFFTFHLDENLNVCDFNKRISDAYIKTTLDTIKIAKQISAPILNMHMANGVYFTLPERKEFLFNQYSSYYFNSLRYFKEQCEQAIGNDNIKICIEKKLELAKQCQCMVVLETKTIEGLKETVSKLPFYMAK